MATKKKTSAEAKALIKKFADARAAKLSPAHVRAYHRLRRLFGKDPKITFGKLDGNSVTLYVSDPEKLVAMKRLLNLDGLAEKTCGLVITLAIPSKINNDKTRIAIEKFENELDERSKDVNDASFALRDLYHKLFKGNPVFKTTVVKDMFPEAKAIYVIFNPVVCQYPADELSSAFGHQTCLIDDVADDLLVSTIGVYHDIARIVK